MDDLKYFPSALETPRPYQLEIARQIVDYFDKYRYVVFLGPTGAGKSAIAVTVHNMLASKIRGASSFFVTPYKILQSQYLETDSSARMYVGRNEYACNCSGTKGMNCAEGYLYFSESKKAFSSGPDCPYEKSKLLCKISPIIVANYPSYLYGNSSINGIFGSRHLMVCDEAHRIENHIINYIAPTIDTDILQVINFDWDGLTKTLENVEAGARGANQKEGLLRLMTVYKRATQYYDYLNIQIKDGKASKIEVKKLDLLSRFLPSLNFMFKRGSNFNDLLKNWFITYKEGETLSARPVRLSCDQSQVLFGKVEKVLAMSATITFEHFCGLLSIPEEQVKYVEFPSYFPPENRPVYIGFKEELTRSKLDKNIGGIFDLTISRIKKILLKHRNQKGVIHVTSYYEMGMVRKALKGWKESGHYFIYLDQEKDKNVLINKHKDINVPSILISPAIKEGLDLKGRLAEFQIIFKVPYYYLDDFIKFRLRTGQKLEDFRYWSDWYQYSALEMVAQAAGRGVRSATDVCPTYILDGQINKVLKSCKKYLWKYFEVSLVDETGL